MLDTLIVALAMAAPWLSVTEPAICPVLACACPIVASAAGGIVDAVRDRVDGRLVPPGDAQALADAVLELLATPATAERYGVAARARAVNDFGLLRERQADVALLQQLVRPG